MKHIADNPILEALNHADFILAAYDVAKDEFIYVNEIGKVELCLTDGGLNNNFKRQWESVNNTVDSKSVEQWQSTFNTGKWYHVIRHRINGEHSQDAYVFIGIQITKEINTYFILEEAQKLSCIGNWAIDIVNNESSWSKEMFSLLGADAEEEASYDKFLEYVHHEDKDRLHQIYHAALKSTEQIIATGRINTKDGAEKHIEVRCKFIEGDSGQPIFSVGTVQDITQRVESELSIRRLEQQNRLLARDAIQLLDNERSRISRELHDDLGQAITGINLSLSYMNKYFQKNNDDKASELINELITQTEILHKKVRNISEDLHPALLNRISLSTSIQELVETWADRDTERQYTTNLGVSGADLSGKLKNTIFRIVQESISNIIRHSQSTKVMVHLNYVDKVKTSSDDEKGQLEIAIVDNGIGADLTELSSGIGLLSMKERVEMAGGSIFIDTAPGQGFSVKAVMPSVECNS